PKYNEGVTATSYLHRRLDRLEDDGQPGQPQQAAPRAPAHAVAPQAGHAPRVEHSSGGQAGEHDRFELPAGEQPVAGQRWQQPTAVVVGEDAMRQRVTMLVRGSRDDPRVRPAPWREPRRASPAARSRLARELGN